MTARCRWLGVAGVELSASDQTLVIDPYLTRIPFRKMWIGPVFPDHRLITEHIRRCDAILVTHPHFDHLMDVPTVAAHTGAMVFGSPNTCQIVRASGIPPGQIRQIAIGERLELGAFRIDVLPARHSKTPIDPIINGPLRAGLKPPLRALDYRMDECFTFLVEVDGLRLLIGSGETLTKDVSADILFAGNLALTGEPHHYYEALTRCVRPRVIIPYHWDDFYRSLSRPIRPSLKPPAWAIPPVQRIDLDGFRQMIRQVAPEMKVVIPEIFHPYNINELW